MKIHSSKQRKPAMSAPWPWTASTSARIANTANHLSQRKRLSAILSSAVPTGIVQLERDDQAHCDKQAEDLESLNIGFSRHFLREHLKMDPPPMVRRVWCASRSPGNGVPPYCVVYHEQGIDTQITLTDFPSTVRVTLTGPPQSPRPFCIYEIVSCEGPTLTERSCGKVG